MDVGVEQAGADLGVVSPDGSRLAFPAGRFGAQDIYVLDIETGQVTQLTDELNSIACHPAWHDAPVDLVQPKPEPAPGEARPFELGKLEAGLSLQRCGKPIALTFSDGW